MTKAYTQSTFWDAIKQSQIKVKEAKLPKVEGLSAETIQKLANKDIKGVSLKRNSGMLSTAFNPFYSMPDQLRKIYPQDLINRFDSQSQIKR